MRTRTTKYPVEEARKIVAEGIPFGPRLHPCVCGAGKHAHTGKHNTGACKATLCRRYRADLAWDLAYQALDAEAEKIGAAIRRGDRILHGRTAQPYEPGQWRIGVSDVDTCPKAIEYRNKPPEDFEPAWEDKREAMAGTLIHESAEARLRVVYPWREFEQRVVVPGLDRDSRFDWYDPVICQAGDIKTAGDWRWDRLGDYGPDEETWGKVMLYGLALEEMGKPVKTVRLDYIKRANGHDESFVRDYDREVAIAMRDRLLGYATALDLDIELPRTGEGPDRDPLCKRCFARNHCWSIPAAERAGRSPYSYTMLGEDPEADAVAWSIEQLVDAREAKKAAVASEDQAKDLLSGVDPGRYGAFEGYTKWGGGGDDWKAYAETLARYFVLPDDQRPVLDDLPLPQKRRYSYVLWGRVRKATLAAEEKARKGAA